VNSPRRCSGSKIRVTLAVPRDTLHGSDPDSPQAESPRTQRMVRELCHAKWSKIMNSALTKSETNSSAVPTPRNIFEPFVSADAVDCYVGIERPTSPGEPRQPKNGGHTVSEWLTSDEAARYLKINRRTLLEWARQGNLKAYKLSGIIRHVWRFRQQDLDDMLSLSSADSADGRQQ